VGLGVIFSEKFGISVFLRKRLFEQPERLRWAHMRPFSEVTTYFAPLPGRFFFFLSLVPRASFRTSCSSCLPAKRGSFFSDCLPSSHNAPPFGRPRSRTLIEDTFLGFVFARVTEPSNSFPHYQNGFLGQLFPHNLRSPLAFFLTSF